MIYIIAYWVIVYLSYVLIYKYNRHETALDGNTNVQRLEELDHSDAVFKSAFWPVTLSALVFLGIGNLFLLPTKIIRDRK